MKTRKYSNKACIVNGATLEKMSTYEKEQNARGVYLYEFCLTACEKLYTKDRRKCERLCTNIGTAEVLHKFRDGALYIKFKKPTYSLGKAEELALNDLEKNGLSVADLVH